MLAAADWLLTAAHFFVVFGFMFLWIPRRTVLVHRWIVVLTAVSWLVLGFWRGLGYCALTDLQWRVKRARGVARLPASFIKYAADYATGMDLPAREVDAVAGLVFVVGCGAAIYRYRQERSLPRLR